MCAMKAEIENKFPPIEIVGNSIWSIEASRRLADEPDKLQPLFIMDPVTSEKIGDFFVHIVVGEDEHEYVQYEGFSNARIENYFLLGCQGSLIKVGQGIYRVKPLRNVLTEG